MIYYIIDHNKCIIYFYYGCTAGHARVFLRCRKQNEQVMQNTEANFIIRKSTSCCVLYYVRLLACLLSHTHITNLYMILFIHLCINLSMFRKQSCPDSKFWLVVRCWLIFTIIVLQLQVPSNTLSLIQYRDLYTVCCVYSVVKEGVSGVREL